MPFARANGTKAGVCVLPTPGRAGDKGFSFFEVTFRIRLQICARKTVAWQRYLPARPYVAARANFRRLMPWIRCHASARRSMLRERWGFALRSGPAYSSRRGIAAGSAKRCRGIHPVGADRELLRLAAAETFRFPPLVAASPQQDSRHWGMIGPYFPRRQSVESLRRSPTQPDVTRLS